MAKRLVTINDGIVLVDKGKIIKKFDLNVDEIVSQIDKIIMQKSSLEPTMIFKNAIESLLPDYTFGNIRVKKKIGDEYFSVHDSSFYKYFYKYIVENDRMIEKFKMMRELVQEHQKYKKENFQLVEYKIKRSLEIRNYRKKN